MDLAGDVSGGDQNIRWYETGSDFESAVVGRVPSRFGFGLIRDSHVIHRREQPREPLSDAVQQRIEGRAETTLLNLEVSQLEVIHNSFLVGAGVLKA